MHCFCHYFSLWVFLRYLGKLPRKRERKIKLKMETDTKKNGFLVDTLERKKFPIKIENGWWNDNIGNKTRKEREKTEKYLDI